MHAIPVLLDLAADRQLNAALHRASIVVCTCDLDLKYTWLANSFPGLAAGDMIGRRDDELLPRESAAQLIAFKSGVLASGRAASIEVPFCQDRETLFYEVRAEPLLGTRGETTGLLLLAIDVTGRKNAEVQAAEIAERYRALAAATREGIVIHDSRNIIEVNEMFCILHGTTRERAIGRPAHHFLTAESSRVALAAIAMNSTEPYEVTAVREDGSTFPLEATGHTVWYQGRRMRVATLRDLSERKTAEEALRRSEARNRSLIQAAATFVWSLSPQGEIPGPQPAWSTWSDYTGQTPGQYLGRGWLQAIHPDDREQVLAGWHEATRSGCFYQGEGRVRRFDGVYRHFLIRGAPVTDHDERVLEWVAATIDVTAQKEAEAALRDSEEKFRGYAEASLDVLWMTDAETGRLEYLSPAYEQVWGEAREVLMQNPRGWREHLHPDDRERVVSAMRTVKHGERLEMEYRIIRADGELRWIRHTGFPIHGPDGRVRRAAGLVRDITRMKENEDRQKLLLGELNHRVKNTLATVQSIARQTLRSASAPELAHERFEDRLLALSKTHNLLTNENWEHASLRELLEQELSPYGTARYRLLGREDVRLAPRAVVALGMALHELTTNAAKYGALSAPSGTVTVGWEVGAAPVRRLSLDWREEGGPAITAQPTRRGFGSRLLERGVTAELGGTVALAFAPTGLTATIAIPLDQANAAAVANSPAA
ncbi:MAG TPA: PAS domain S-box protein [Microvirga sp.]|nr:PAS domain S-box protein [Microvirga sp.]